MKTMLLQDFAYRVETAKCDPTAARLSAVAELEARLLEGNMDAFSATWRLTPVEGGARTEVDFKIYVDPDMPLPASVFSRENERAAGKTVRALHTRVLETARPS